MGIIENIRRNRQEKDIKRRLDAITSLTADSPRAMEQLEQEAKVFERVMLSRREIQKKEKEGIIMKEVIIDYDNAMLIFRMPSQQGTEHILSQIDKLGHINSLGDISNDVYVALCKAAIIGFDFAGEQVKVYKPITYDNTNGALYPEHLLQVKDEYPVPGLNDKFEAVMDALGYEPLILNIEF